MSPAPGVRHFHEELARLKTQLLEMSGLAEELVTRALEALRARDAAAAQEVVRRDNDLDDLVERSLRQAALWEEVSDRLDRSALGLSGGQQQRLCIARALAVQPEVLLMDEPASALDPIATQKIEELIYELKDQYTIVIVTHNMQQAARVSDYTAFMYMGDLIEYDRSNDIFTNPREERTEAYITGRFG